MNQPLNEYETLKNKLMEQLGFRKLTPIQEKVIPEILKGRDLVAASATGTGKTHAFLLPLLALVDPSLPQVQAVITAPTRELAQQLYRNAKQLQTVMPELRIKLISGGTDREKAAGQLRTQPHIVIGTPGRIKDLFLKEGALLVNTASLMVIDEADMTMEYGFMEDIDAIVSHMGHKLQMLVFSATVPQGMKPFLKKYLHDPVMVKLETSLDFDPQIEHILIPCRHRSYGQRLLDILPGFQPYTCLIFSNTRSEAHDTAELMRDHGYRVLELHGDLSARQRKQALKQLNERTYQYIVATDIASRGLDIDAVSHVVSLGFPSDISFYIHRSGRTGRTGREGVCYALYKDTDARSIRLLSERGIKFNHRDYRNETWKELKPFGYKRRRQPTELDREITKIVKRPTEVKPGYKKKRSAAIAKLKQQHKRAIIRESIKEQKKERAKARQRASYSGSQH